MSPAPAERLLRDLGQLMKRIEPHLPKAGALERLLLPSEVADLLRLEHKTLEAWRSKGRGPAYVKLGRDVRYRIADVLRFVEDRVCRSTWEAAGKMVSERL